MDAITWIITHCRFVIEIAFGAESVAVDVECSRFGGGYEAIQNGIGIQIRANIQKAQVGFPL